MLNRKVHETTTISTTSERDHTVYIDPPKASNTRGPKVENRSAFSLTPISYGRCIFRSFGRSCAFYDGVV
eukprot:5898933-Amphidinium_carterae.1